MKSKVLANQKIIRRYQHRSWFLAVILFFIAVGVVLYVTRPAIISPCSESGCAVRVVYAKDEASELEQIVSYIVSKWEKHGHAETVHALSCFISESGLRTKAVGVNNNGSNDVGIAQINSIHGMSTEDRMNYRKNIDKAYEIYKSRSWAAWYGGGC